MAIDNTQIDEAVPPAGTPVRSKTNQLLRDLRDTAEGAASGLDAHKSSGDHDGRYPLKTTTVTGTGALTGGGGNGLCIGEIAIPPSSNYVMSSGYSAGVIHSWWELR